MKNFQELVKGFSNLKHNFKIQIFYSRQFQGQYIFIIHKLWYPNILSYNIMKLRGKDTLHKILI